VALASMADWECDRTSIALKKVNLKPRLIKSKIGKNTVSRRIFFEQRNTMLGTILFDYCLIGA
jgi:hypothetical protein